MDIGEKLKELRIQRNLTQEELADRSELSKGFISQVERNLTSPSIATLTDLLESLGVSLQNFFVDNSDEKIVFQPHDMFEKQDEEKKITWLIPDAQKNCMEPILLELVAGGKSHTLPPFEGESFGYVLKGQVQLIIGKRTTLIKKGASFCFHPSATHYLQNLSEKPATVLWVTTPPNF